MLTIIQSSTRAHLSSCSVMSLAVAHCFARRLLPYLLFLDLHLIASQLPLLQFAMLQKNRHRITAHCNQLA